MPIDIISPFESVRAPSLPVCLCISRPLLSLLMEAGGEKKIWKQCSLKQAQRDNICSGWVILNMGRYNFETI